MPRRTKIIATLGPASEPEETLRAMIEAGCDVVRLNLAHGTVGQAIERMRLVRRLAAETGRVVGILADLPGPKVRLTEFVEGGLLLHEGDTVSVAPGTDPSGPDGLWVDYPLLIDDVGPGDVLTLHASDLADIVGTQPTAQALRQAKSLSLRIGTPNAETLKTALAVTAADEQTAQQVYQALMGLRALAMLRAAEEPEAAGLASQIGITCEGSAVRMDFGITKAQLQTVLQNRKERLTAPPAPAGNAP